MTKREQIKDILKCIFNNYIGVFMITSSSIMIAVGIQTGLLIGLFIDVFWIWLVCECLYWVIGKTIKFIKIKLNKRGLNK